MLQGLFTLTKQAQAEALDPSFRPPALSFAQVE
jgi:hypothetical protein